MREIFLSLFCWHFDDIRLCRARWSEDGEVGFNVFKNVCGKSAESKVIGLGKERATRGSRFC